MAFQEKIVGKSQILEAVEAAAEIAVSTYGLKIWGLELVGGLNNPVVRIFIDTPWEGKIIPFVKPETRSQKSKKKAIHPKMLESKKDNLISDELNDVINPKVNAGESISKESTNDEFLTDDFIDNDFSDMEDSNPDSVSIGQCTHISRMIGLALEVEDTFADTWVLEVSSPGLERGFYKLSQLSSYIGHPIETTLEDPHPDHENRRKFRGTLESVDDLSFTLILDAPLSTPCIIPWDTIKKARLVHIFPDTTLTKA